MSERLKQLPGQLLERWKKFDVKQRALMISSAAVVIIALVILGVVLNTPKLVTLKECENTKQASEVQRLLKDNDIFFEVTNDGLVFSVKEEDEAAATLLLGENNITAYMDDWGNLENVFNGGFSRTDADKNKSYQLYKEIQLEERIQSLDSVEQAQVTLNIPPDNGTLIERHQESYAWVVLTLNSEMSKETAAGLGRAVATSIGNDTTDNIQIMDSAGNVLFSGGESANDMASANDNLEYRSNLEVMVGSKIHNAMMETGLYDSVSVAPNLDIDFSQKEITDTDWHLGEGLDEPLPGKVNEYTSDTQGAGEAAVPGTDANDNTTYVTPDGEIYSASVSDIETEYQNSSTVTHEVTPQGVLNPETSSISVVASSYRIYDEAEMRRNGQLDGQTFDEFKAANQEIRTLEVSEELLNMVSKATGIPVENVSVMAQEIPMFNYAGQSGRTFMDYLPIILAALIMLMLGYVVFRSTRKEKQPEMEPELSVEALLESTREAQEELEDIGFGEKSDARILIEKFVDENPEAVASLLRNWLNEEWE